LFVLFVMRSLREYPPVMVLTPVELVEVMLVVVDVVAMPTRGA
jgi:hypothetical protein